MNDIKKIIDNLEKTKDNQHKVKEKVSSWAEQLGIQEELVDSEITLWKELDQKGNTPIPITTSGNFVSQDLLNQSKDLVQYVDSSKIPQALTSLGTISVAGSGIIMSGVSLMYTQSQIPQAYVNLERLNNQQIQQTDISNRIRAVNPTLADEYDNAWTSLYSGITDKTRSPMFLMREVITHLIHHYSPDNSVRTFHSLPTGEVPTRRQRVQYIASRIDPSIRQAFINQEQAILDVYGALNNAHTPSTLDTEQTKGYLYQANALIKLLLDSI